MRLGEIYDCCRCGKTFKYVGYKCGVIHWDDECCHKGDVEIKTQDKETTEISSEVTREIK